MNREEFIEQFRKNKLPEYLEVVNEQQEFEELMKNTPKPKDETKSIKCYKCSVCGNVKPEHFFGLNKKICLKCQEKQKKFTCIRCGKKKPISEFYGKYKKVCKTCKNEYQMTAYYKRRIKLLEEKINEYKDKINKIS